MDHSINYFTLLSQAIWKCKNWKENHRHFQLWRERHKLIKKKSTVFYFHTHDVHLVNAPFLKKKKSFLIPCKVRCRGSVNHRAIWREFWAENCLGKGLGNSELSFFFLPPHFPHICKLLCCQNAKEYFSFFYIHKKLSALHCLSFQSKHLGQCYREACN